ncbi:MAG: UDP-3-O-acyl-N-acetylglucosamine deacetylase [Alphaproteobacteria bacterium]
MLGEMGIVPQRTLRNAASCRGIGLHCGQPVAITLRPAAPDSGIVFRRSDAGAEVRADWSNSVESALSTVLSNREGIHVATVEHLMAALAGNRIDNAVIELDGPEVPIMDGSAAPFVRLIESAGTEMQDAPRRAIKIMKPVEVAENGSSAALLPDAGFSMSFEIDFDNPLIRHQDISLTVDPEAFNAELAPARTFGMLDDWPRLKAAGLARGGSLDNAIVVSGDRVLNAGGLRFADEFVRHKLVDAIGDLFLAGGAIIGHFRGSRSGHALTRRLLTALFADPASWRFTTMFEAADLGAPVWTAAARAEAA